MTETNTSWKWTRRFGVSLTISVAAFEAWGALAPHLPWAAHTAPVTAGVLMAAMYGNSQGLANCMAANMRRAWEAGHGYRLPALFFAGCFAGFALLSMSGLHTAWAFVKLHAGEAPLPDDGLMQDLFYFVAFSEPAMNYAVEALKALHKVNERAEEREERVAAADRAVRQHDAEARRRAMIAVAPAVSVAMAPAAVAEAMPPELPRDQICHSAPVETTADAHAAHGWGGPRNEAKWKKFMEATELGLRPMEIVREAGIPSTTVYRWRRLFGAKRSNSH